MKTKVNTKLYTVNEIYTTLNHAKTYEMFREMKDINDELELDKVSLMYDFADNDVESEKLISDIELQQTYLHKNLQTLDNVLYIHESKLVKTEICFGLRCEISIN